MRERLWLVYLRYEWVRMFLYESKLGGTGYESERIDKGRLDPMPCLVLKVEESRKEDLTPCP